MNKYKRRVKKKHHMTNNTRNYNPSKHKYFAFISYRGADVELAKKLQKKFNTYKLSSNYAIHFPFRKRIFVFF